MLAESIMKKDVVTVERDHTVLRVARLMRDEDVGCVVVVDERGRPVGIVTDRDIVIKVTAEQIADGLPVDEIMSTPVIAVPENTLIFDLLRQMAAKQIHRMPVVDRGKKLVGVVNVDDAMVLLTTEMANIADVVARNARRDP